MIHIYRIAVERPVIIFGMIEVIHVMEINKGLISDLQSRRSSMLQIFAFEQKMRQKIKPKIAVILSQIFSCMLKCKPKNEKE